MPIKVSHLKPEFVDERGFITRLIDQDRYSLRAVLYITSKAGTVRGNHYHKKDTHYTYCLSGSFKYSEKDMRNSNSQMESLILKPGDLVLSAPMTAHSMEFLEDTVLLVFTTKTRKQDPYEKDTVRLKLK